ncbi:MAG: Tab2 family RNA-binding protein [Pseudanabaenaceae cyanobacterium]
MPEIWELDFYSRPVKDQDGKKIWELLICDRQRQREWVQVCPPNQVNSEWVANQLAEVVQTWQVSPQKIRFYRPTMHNMLNRACKLANLVPLPSRRLLVMPQWLQERMAEVYPQQAGFIAPDPNPLPLQLNQPTLLKPLPDALRGDKWLFAFLPAQEFANAHTWAMDFGELFPLPPLSPDQPIGGVIVYSTRAAGIAAWMSGIDPVCLECAKDQLILSANADAQWVISKIKDVKGAENFQQAQQQAQGIHFLAVQTNPETEKFAGFWLLRNPTV